jgi:putative ABC transport system permease protein
MRMFVRQGLVLTTIGAAVGLLTAIALTQWMSSLLFGVERLDPPEYAAVLAVLGVLGMAVRWPATCLREGRRPSIQLRP